MIIKFNKKQLLKTWKSYGLGAWCKTWIRMGILDPKGIATWFILIALVITTIQWIGAKNKPIEISTDLVAYDKELSIRLDPKEVANIGADSIGIKKPANSRVLRHWNWRDDILGKPIKVENVDQLRDKLKPYGFENKFIFVGGVGISTNDVSGESGIGYRYARLWKLRAEIVATEKGFYPISVSYKPDWFFKNTNVNIGFGKQWEEGNNRYFFGGNVEF
ncbi:MAG: hypothetical protein ACTSPD_10015 [Promethearchaeota archaeon]